MHFLLRARAVAVFPGGFGTFDESFELLTLVQTGKVAPMPILFFGKEFWTRVVNFEALVAEGVISPNDLRIFSFVETARSEEHTSELQSLMRISYAVFCLKKIQTKHTTLTTQYHLL